jgi:hypothetical protein
MTHRVVQWSTGNVGKLALQGILDHPDLELVGLWVHNPDKAGRDAGELAGREPVGVIATNDVGEILALGADCVSHNATGDLRPVEAVEEMCELLASGANVVSTSVVNLIYPPAADKGMVEKLAAACKAGGSSFFTSGIDPGFANDLLPLVLSGFSSRIDSIRVMEILDYSTYTQPEVLFETMGFGKPLDHEPLMLLPGSLTYAWGGVIAMLADALGVELDEIRETHEKWAAAEAISTDMGVLEAGTMAGLRFEIQGIVDGEPKLVVEHVTRMNQAVAPEWPQWSGQGSYRILVSGNPTMKCELELLGEDGDHNTGGLLATAMRLLNAIPAVCDAPPGLLSTLDLPLVTGRNLMH